MKMSMALLSLLAACQSSQPSLTQTTAGGSVASRDDDSVTFDLLLSVRCGDDAGCESLEIDGAEFTSTGGDIVDWSWEIDGTSYEGASVTHTFALDATLDSSPFSGSVTVMDASGNTASAGLSFTATFLSEDSGGGGSDDGSGDGGSGEDTGSPDRTGDDGDLPKPTVFWFSGISPANEQGFGCQQTIVAVSGCLTAPFDMTWRDMPSGDITALMSWTGTYASSYDPDYIDYVMLANPPRLRMRLLLPTSGGWIQATKPNGQIITHESHCTDPFAPQ